MKMNIVYFASANQIDKVRWFYIDGRKMSEGIFKIKCSNCRKMCVNMLL